jgi:hypothetical protein
MYIYKGNFVVFYMNHVLVRLHQTSTVQSTSYPNWIDIEVITLDIASFRGFFDEGTFDRVNGSNIIASKDTWILIWVFVLCRFVYSSDMDIFILYDKSLSNIFLVFSPRFKSSIYIHIICCSSHTTQRTSNTSHWVPICSTANTSKLIYTISIIRANDADLSLAIVASIFGRNGGVLDDTVRMLYLHLH